MRGSEVLLAGGVPRAHGDFSVAPGGCRGPSVWACDRFPRVSVTAYRSQAAGCASVGVGLLAAGRVHRLSVHVGMRDRWAPVRERSAGASVNGGAWRRRLRINGSTALVTGASGGLGVAIARALAARGAAVVLTGRRIDVLQRLAAELGGRAVAADLADPADIERLAAEPGVDILIANAGLPGTGPVLDFDVARMDKVLAVNLRAPMVLSKLLAEPMVAAGRGHLVLIGSISGRTASPGGAVYSATKFGLRGFAHGLRQDLHGTGVGVSLIQPGFVRDAGMFAESGATLPPGVRTVAPQAVANAVVHAIVRNRGEVDVAPIEVRLGGIVGGLFPELAARVQRRAGGARLARQMAHGQRDKG
jgi:short-subunit dehydrogenase